MQLQVPFWFGGKGWPPAPFESVHLVSSRSSNFWPSLITYSRPFNLANCTAWTRICQVALLGISHNVSETLIYHSLGPLHTQGWRPVTMKLWEPKRKCPKAVQRHLRNHVVWSWTLKCSAKPYVTGPSTKCYFNGFLFMRVLTHDKVE